MAHRDSAEDQFAEAMLAERQRLLHQLQSSPAFQRLCKLDEMYEEWTGQRPAPVPAISPGVPLRPPAESASRFHGSTKDLAAAVFEMEPDIVFNYDLILSRLEAAKAEVPAQHPRNALRTACQVLEREGVIERVGRGSFRLAKAPGWVAREREGEVIVMAPQPGGVVIGDSP